MKRNALNVVLRCGHAIPTMVVGVGGVGVIDPKQPTRTGKRKN